MVSDKVQPALNDQLNAEFYAAFLYLGMSAYFQTRDLNGFAHWMRIQAREELEHAMRIYDFINERDGKIELRSIEAPPMKWESPLAAFENAYEHEKEVTAQINKLVDLAVKNTTTPQTLPCSGSSSSRWRRRRSQGKSSIN